MMLSKFFRPTSLLIRNRLLVRNVIPHLYRVTRLSGDLIPPTQYDIPIPARLGVGVLRVYWETIPLFVCTGFALWVLFYSIFWACRNKVDVVFTTRSRNNISRTMDLRNPTVHKMVIINQRYMPWPEMQNVLDKMTEAERRARARAEKCPTI